MLHILYCVPKNVIREIKTNCIKHYIYNFFYVSDAIKQMLNLNQPLTKAVANEPSWKVLVYDRIGQDIISPLISVKELRELGVTLHV